MARHLRIGQAVHRAEKEAIDFLVDNLPPNYLVYSNVELATGRPGQTFEHDAIVIAPHAVFTVEIKSWGGIIRGNRDRWSLRDGSMWHSPIPPTQAKARVLKSRLKARRADLARVWVQGLIFLSATDADPHISPDYADLVTTRRDVITALTDPNWFHLQGVMRPGQRTTVEMLLADGRPRKAPETLGSKFELVEKLDVEDRPYEAWIAKERLGGHRHVLHVHTLAADSKEEREALERHALREATLHQRLRGGPNILRYDTYFFEEDPHRIVLQFEDTTPLLPLPGWVQEHNPSLVTRLQVARRIVQAVAWVHKRSVALRGLTADTILVDEHPDDVRLCAFDVAKDTTTGSTTIVGSGITTHRTSAPEVLKNGIADEVSDLFALGATLYELFAGRPLFDSLDAILQDFSVPPVDVAGRRLPADVHVLLVRLLDKNGLQRPKAEEALEILDEAIHAQTHKRYTSALEQGTVVRDNFELEKRLGRGATATTWLANHLQTGQSRVLKISSPESADMLALECRILTDVQHKNLVRAYDVGPEGERQVLVLEHVAGFTGREQIEAGDPPGPEAFRTAAKGLFEAVQALHDAGWLHRDVKPENLIFRSEKLEPVLLDLGLACSTSKEGDLTVGTPRYKDPLVYSEGRWSKANDIYAVYVVLAELLTGAHPFGGRAPEEARAAEVAFEEVSDAFEAAIAKDVVDALLDGLSASREDRPKDALEAWASVEKALGMAEDVAAPARRPVDLPTTPDIIEPSTSVWDLPLGTRAQGALSRLKVRTAAELAGLDAKAARRLPNVGAKTQRELERWANELAARWPDLAPSVDVAPEPELYPSLRLDDRPLTALGNALTPHFRQVLQDRNIRTIGHLASTTASTLLAIPRFGETKLTDVRDALSRLAGSHAPPPSLKVLDQRIRDELGARGHALLASVIGLHDGEARSLADAGRLFDVTRQRVDQAADLSPLRAPASEAAALVRLVEDILPPAGVAPVEFVAAALADRLGEEPGVSARGYAVFAALLLDGDKRASFAPQVEMVFRPPWTAERLDAARGRLAEATRWPYRRAHAEQEAWEALPDDLQIALVRRGCDASQLLTALLRLVPDITVDPYGALYVPPLQLVDILREHRADLLPQSGPVDANRILEVIEQTWKGVRVPEDVEQALKSAGWGQENGRWFDPERYQPAEKPVKPVVDDDVPRQQVSTSSVPPVVRALAAAADVGGVRVVAMPPGRAHAWTNQLVSWLAEELGEERPVELVNLDRVVLQALKDNDLWHFATYQEQAREQDQDWGWAHDVMEAALEVELGRLNRDSVTVLGDPALLGPLGLMHWLSGFYERARGGRHGLIVLAMPGGVHDNRVRLNERYNLPYTPDMAAVYLDEVA